ncbi:DUF4145 domain-containing protein [Bacillus subtilis]|uniref:DUF4145 domain-containing protein n=1 Tax=Bacillus subtilis TaxID=1423 RepID=UPI002417E141|nr:DUF4145 domain-containing protein [Bacillus subtilis]WFO98103.1 DUF4145 domain-containing protein [Bacillus subtilis]
MELDGVWIDVDRMESNKYKCAYCDALVASDLGITCERELPSKPLGKVLICPHCNRPTFLEYSDYDDDDDVYVKQFPSPQYRTKIDYLPVEIDNAYNEIRNCMSNQSYTAVVLLARKLLMNIAVDSGAKEGKKFIEYIDYLEEEGFIPKNGREWVDVIRQAGNIATHKIPSVDSKTAHDVLSFLEFLLRIKYEMPGKMAKEYNK